MGVNFYLTLLERTLTYVFWLFKMFFAVSTCTAVNPVSLALICHILVIVTWKLKKKECFQHKEKQTCIISVNYFSSTLKHEFSTSDFSCIQIKIQQQFPCHIRCHAENKNCSYFPKRLRSLVTDFCVNYSGSKFPNTALLVGTGY